MVTRCGRICARISGSASLTVASLLARNGIITVVAVISPYKQARDEVRSICENFVEVHVDCGITTLIARDTKGMYAKAIKGEIKNFTGISDPYEPPENPEVYVNTGTTRLSECVDRICEYLEEKNLTAFVSQEDWPRPAANNA
jgi:adenylylsulfate kinase-like enzyme